MTADISDQARTLFTNTPLLRSAPLSHTTGVDVYIKLDCLQASGSFKDRGMAHLLTELSKQQYQQIISSSGGNAGLAAATVAHSLRLSCTVIVPNSTKPIVIDKLKALGATVQIHGDVWNQADEYARDIVAQNPTTIAYVPPYEHELLWTGHSTVVDEIYDMLTPAAIVLSVGGGGLLCGVLEGLERHDATDCHVVAAETMGASSFAQAFESGERVRLSSIDSIATSLGALQVSETALTRAKHARHPVSTAVCTDAQALDACLQVRRCVIV